MASVSATVSSRVMPRRNTAMASAATWPSDDAAVGEPGDEEGDLLGRQRVAVALGADDLLRQAGPHQ